LRRIALLTPFLTTADAISNDLYGMHEVLTKAGYDSQLFAQSSATNGIEVRPANEIRDFLKQPDDLLIYHYSMGWDFGLDLIRDPIYQVAIKYHNITPPEFFTGISIDYEIACRRGRDQIKDIAQADCDVYLADSEYNSWELLLEGVEKSKSFVVPPFHQVDRLKSVAPAEEVLDAYVSDKVNILMVGRVAPNKGHAALIEALAIYRSEHQGDARLLIVGKEPLQMESYSTSLRELVAQLKLEDHVVFTGAVSEEQLKAYYLVADFFLMTSDHEGFCVPLVEAMSMNVPIIAYASSAVPGTVGKAGLVWKERNPYLLAESIDYLAADESASAALGLMGRRRFEQFFSNERIEVEFLKALDQLTPKT
jgi:glycosyltransferase involved in cell wall biosynthesis